LKIHAQFKSTPLCQAVRTRLFTSEHIQLNQAQQKTRLTSSAVNQLPKSQQKFVAQMLDALIAQATTKASSEGREVLQ